MAGAFHVIVAPRYSPTGIGSHDPAPPTRGEMTTRTTPVTDTSADAAPGVQLVQPDVASATQPGLFDHLPDSALTVHHRTLVDARPGDRMLLCLGLDVSASAVKVATALAFHGWSSWPSRETLASQTNLHPNHVSRACKELEDAGIVSRRRRYHKGGNVGIQYTFRGDALVAATAGQNHPTLGPSISALAAGRSANTNLVSAEVQDEDSRRAANTNLVSAEVQDEDSRRAANTNLVSAGDGQSPDAGANTNLVSAEVQDEDSRRAANTNLVSAGDGQSPDAGANTNLVSAEVQDEDSRRAANTNLVSAGDGQSPDAGANTNLVSAEVQDEDSRRAANTNLVSAGDGQSPDAGANTNLVSAEVQDEDSRRAANTNLVSAGDGQSPDAGANTNLVSAEVQDEDSRRAANTNLVSAQLGPTTREYQFGIGANTNLVSAEVQDEDSRRAANTNLVSAQLGPTTREYQFGIGANTNLVPEPEVTEPEGMILTDDINQSNSGSSGSGDARAKNESPPWYRELAAALDPGRVPDLQAIEEQAFLAGWSDAVLQSAARIYLRNYRNQRVTDPLALFRKLAIQEASRLPPPEPQRRGKYSEDHRRRKSQDT